MDNLVELNQVCFARDTAPILKGVDIVIPRKSLVAIMGPSGTGKTTLLRLIGGELRPKSGHIAIDGTNIAELKHRELYQMRRRMGILFQQGGLFTDLNVYENVAFPLREHTNLPDDMIHDLVLLYLQAVGLRGAAQLRIDQLSGGMARRVALARSVILGPDLMLYDEPFTGQDPIMRGVLLKLIRELNDALGLTSVIVSHDVHETAQIADYMYIISQGLVVGEGKPDELLNDDFPYIKQFVNGLPDGAVSFHYPAQTLQEDLQL